MNEFQYELKSQPHKLPSVTVKELTGKEWDPKHPNRDIWADPNEAADRKLLHSAELSLPMEAALPALHEVNLPLLEWIPCKGKTLRA